MYLIFAQLSLYATLEGFVYVTWAKLYYGWRVRVPQPYLVDAIPDRIFSSRIFDLD